MFALELICPNNEAELVAAELWEFDAVALSEDDRGNFTKLVAGFDDEHNRDELLARFSRYHPAWTEDNTDWEMETRHAWPGRKIGERLFLAPVWCAEDTPIGRIRVVHNPGLASGTGEHPCTQLALEALETLVTPAVAVADIGTGSGILTVAARLLGAETCVALDTDWDCLATARENLSLNQLKLCLAAGSASCLADSCAQITVANISSTVLLSILDDLLRITAEEGTLILTGFSEPEAKTFLKLFPQAQATERNGWCCLVIPLSSGPV